VNKILHNLLHPERLTSRQEVIGRSSIVPAEPGIYAWYFKQSPSRGIQWEKCWSCLGHHLLYIGISPKKPSTNGTQRSSQNLRKRIAYHMRGNAYGSTLRLSVGCLLAASLGIQLRRVGSGTRMTFSDGEVALSEWFDSNVGVTWITHLEPWAVEAEAISNLYLPLNLDQNSAHPFHAMLSAARRTAKEEAKGLPVLPT
jgi:GIY-YIG catalytic domain